MTFQDPYKQGIFNLAEAYKGQFVQNAEAFLKCVGSMDSVRGCLVSLYRILLSRGECQSIETLSEGDKRELWAEAKRISTIQDKGHLLEVVKAVHAFGNYLQI